MKDFERPAVRMELCEGACGAHYPWLESFDGKRLCADDLTTARADKARRAQGQRLHAQLDQVAQKFLEEAGLTQRDRDSVLDKVPASIAQLLHADTAIFALGQIPTTGFGLSGMAGHGKSCAIASLLKLLVYTKLDRELPTKGPDVLALWARWHYWPATVYRLRNLSMREGGMQQAEELVDEAMQVPMLVLDDLGAERLKGSYAEDWAASQLDLIVDARFGNYLPIWYTTQLSHDRLLNLYGQRLFSRLIGGNPMYLITDGSDLRTAP